MIAVVHSPDYVTASPPRSTYRWGKNGAIRDLLLAEGAAIDWHAPAPMPRAWLEATHDPDYVAEVLEARATRQGTLHRLPRHPRRRAPGADGARRHVSCRLARARPRVRRQHRGRQPPCAVHHRRGLLRVQRSGRRRDTAGGGGGACTAS